MIFDGEKINEFVRAFRFKLERTQSKRIVINGRSCASIKKIAQGKEVSGLAAYE